MRNGLIWVILACFVSLPLFSEIDPVIAKIKLTKLEVVTQRQFRKQVEQLEIQLKRPFTSEQKRQLLDAFIGNKIILQAADRSKISVSQAETNRMLELYKQDLGMRSGLNRSLSSAELEKMLNQEGFSWDKLVKQVTDQIKMEKYVTQEKQEMFRSIAGPTESEILEYYESNRTHYPIVSPEMVSFKQIAILTKSLTAGEEGKAKRRADNIYRQLQNGVSFDKFLEVYLESGNSRKVGGLSFDTWRRDDVSQKLAYGKTYFDAVFKLKQGQRSRVLKSNAGYHIVEIIEKIEFKVLGLNDSIPPVFRENLTR